MARKPRTPKTSVKVAPRHPGGRPSKYRPEYCQALIDYCSGPLTRTRQKIWRSKSGQESIVEIDEAERLPTLEGFAQSIDIGADVISQWSKDHEEFGKAVKRAKALIKEFLIQNSLAGRYDGNFAKFVACNYTDMRDKQEVAHTVQVDAIEIAVKVVE